MMTGRTDICAGVMIPIPQYPLYTATIAEYHAHAVSINWGGINAKWITKFYLDKLNINTDLYKRWYIIIHIASWS